MTYKRTVVGKYKGNIKRVVTGMGWGCKTVSQKSSLDALKTSGASEVQDVPLGTDA